MSRAKGMDVTYHLYLQAADYEGAWLVVSDGGPEEDVTREDRYLDQLVSEAFGVLPGRAGADGHVGLVRIRIERLGDEL